MPDVALLVELVGNLVAHNAAALVEASEAHDRELSDELRRPQRWLRAGQALHARRDSRATRRVRGQSARAELGHWPIRREDFAHREALMRLLSEAPS